MLPFVVFQLNPFNWIGNPTIFLTVFILVGALFGAISRKLSIMGFGALLIYVYVVINTDVFIFNALLYVVLAVILLWTSRFVVAGYLDMGDEGEPA